MCCQGYHFLLTAVPQLLQGNSTPIVNGHHGRCAFDPSNWRIHPTLMTGMIFRHPEFHLGLSDAYYQLYLARPNPWTERDAIVHRQPFIFYHRRIFVDYDIYNAYRKHNKNVYNTYRKHLNIFPFDYDKCMLQIYGFLFLIAISLV